MKAYGVKVDIKDPYFKTISRQKQLHLPTNLASEIRMTSLEILKTSWNLSDPIRLLTITAINLTDETADEQLSLFDHHFLEVPPTVEDSCKTFWGQL